MAVTPILNTENNSNFIRYGVHAVFYFTLL